MKPKEERTLAFTYGLGQMPIHQDPVSDKIRLFVGNRATLDKPVMVSAYVKGGEQKVTLALPRGLKFAAGQQAEQTVPPANGAGYAQVSWQLTASEVGSWQVEVTGTDAGKASALIRVLKTSMFE
jgi:hypothetical protein